jgi:serine/threonine-protein kinase HipA
LARGAILNVGAEDWPCAENAAINPIACASSRTASTKELQRLGETRMGGTPSRVRQILERTEAAIADTSNDLQAYVKAHAEFMEIGNRMLQQWEQGVALSLKA